MHAPSTTRRFAAALLAAAGMAAAAHAAPAPPTGMIPHTVAPLTVYPHTDPPKIVGSYPAEGQVVAPGTLVMRITFDQKMDEHAFAVTAAPGAEMPACLKTPRLLADDKTFVLLCSTRARSSYVLAFNAQPVAGSEPRGFENIAGSRAIPAQLAFATDESDGPRSLDAALKAASLTRNDVPIATDP